MNVKTRASLREEVRELAQEAFHKTIISGHGDGENAQEYQLVIEGKPRHYSLENARAYLSQLLETHSN